MINNPEFVKIGDKKFKINTSYKVALRCEKVSQDNCISDTERALAIIYLLFGDAGLEDKENWENLLKAAKKYLNCAQKVSLDDNKKDFDYVEDERFIKTSFIQEYNIDLSKVSLHWWDFFDLLNGLSDKAVLSRIREIRNFDLSKIKDPNEKEKWIRAKKQFALKSCIKNKKYTADE